MKILSSLLSRSEKVFLSTGDFTFSRAVLARFRLDEAWNDENKGTTEGRVSPFVSCGEKKLITKYVNNQFNEIIIDCVETL